MLRTRLLVALVALAVFSAACGGDEPVTDPIQTDAYLRYRGQPTACGADTPPSARDLQFAEPEDMGLTGIVTATIETSCGRIVLELDADVAPATVNSFVFLAEAGYFDGTVSHRIFPDFIVQAGDPTATGSGGPGYVVPDEFATPAIPDVTEQVFNDRMFLSFAKGSVAMTNAGPGTTGSQWFIALEDAVLPPQFTWFGRVASGFETLDRIERIPLAQGRSDPVPTVPVDALYIESVSIDR